ncbi:hypothetical protein NSQ54_09950 [Alkalihalobacillus sp. FSL W8-0930]
MRVLRVTAKYLVIAIGLFITLGPFYWMVVGATNSSGSLLSVPPNLIPGDQLATNFRNLIDNIDIF